MEDVKQLVETPVPRQEDDCDSGTLDCCRNFSLMADAPRSSLISSCIRIEIPNLEERMPEMSDEYPASGFTAIIYFLESDSSNLKLPRGCCLSPELELKRKEFAEGGATTSRILDLEI
ncbi:unnamed protein product [Linum trigynum]|uniref:Uncharacterized protein n=1 Tax=Linum trigynum TaxID=586398 RepID=A0AAV2EAI1_9ROSI